MGVLDQIHRPNSTLLGYTFPSFPRQGSMFPGDLSVRLQAQNEAALPTLTLTLHALS